MDDYGVIETFPFTLRIECPEEPTSTTVESQPSSPQTVDITTVPTYQWLDLPVVYMEPVDCFSISSYRVLDRNGV